MIHFSSPFFVDALYNTMLRARSSFILVATLKINELYPEASLSYKEILLLFKRNLHYDIHSLWYRSPNDLEGMLLKCVLCSSS